MLLNFPASMNASSGLQSLGKYKILGTLGRGSMGIVYKAQDPEIGRVVAIKTLRKVFAAAGGEDFPATLERFKLEARSAGNLRHPNIITVFDVNIEGDTPYIVMDYVEGETLDRIIARQGRLAPALALHYMAGVASGLDYAHSKGVIHRDIKPSNILVDKAQHVYLLDFGIARMTQSLNEAPVSETPASEAILGTPGYMSPDQILNQQLDHRSDLFALAVVTFEALCGQRPFPGDNFTAVIGSILNAKPLNVREIVPELPAALEVVFNKALSRDREQRYNSGQEFIEACREVLMLQSDLVSGSGIPAAGASAPRRKRLSTWKSLPSLEQSADVRKFPQINIHRSKSAEEESPAGYDTDSPWLPTKSNVSSDLNINPRGQHHRQQLQKPGDVFSNDGKVVYLGRPSEIRPASMLRNMTMLFTLLCLFLAGILAWAVLKQSKDVNVPLPNGAVSFSSIDNSILPPSEDLLMPRVAAAPAGKAIEEMEGAEVLGVLADPHASELNLLNALREAKTRRLPGLAAVTALVTLNNDSYVVRIEAIKTLGDLGDKRVVPRLVTSLDDYDPLVRGNAAKALSALGSRAALSYLRVRHLKEDDPGVKQAMQIAIDKLEGIKTE